ncbi:hypothetical protein VTO73DRAFT_10330 [Trametes versicolor]
MAAQWPATFKPGTYFLLNVCFNTAITLSADDHRTISGATYNPNGSLYQEVKLHQTTLHDENQFWEDAGGDGLDKDMDLFYGARQWKYSLCHPDQAQATSSGRPRAAGPMSANSIAVFQPGTYILFNDYYGTALTLSADDCRTIRSDDFDPDGSPCQEHSSTERVVDTPLNVDRARESHRIIT